MWKLNLYALVVTLPPIAILASVYLWMWGDDLPSGFSALAFSFALIVFGVLAHETLHCLS